MPFDDSLIGSNDFDPRTATEDLIRRTSDEPLPDTLDPRMLNTRLARKLGRAPSVTAPSQKTPTPEPSHSDELDFSSQAAPAPNMEPSGKDALDFTAQVTPPAPAVNGGIGGPTAFGKGLVTGAVEGAGGVMKGAARLGNEAAPYLESLQYDPYGNVIGQDPLKPAKPIEQNPLYHAGKVVEGAHPEMSPEERDSLTGRVGTMAGGIAPYAAAAIAGGPALGIAAGFAGMGADTYGKVFEDAKSKGADDATATAAASKAATAAGILGSLPLGTGKLASSIVGKIISQGITFAGTNEATEYVLQEIAKDYDEKAGYTPEAKRIIASLITGGAIGGLHSFERKKPEAGNDTTSPHDANGPAPDGALPGGKPDFEQKGFEGKTWKDWGFPDEDGTGTGPEPGPKGGPQPGGAKAKPGEQQSQQKPGEAPKGEGEEVPDDHTVDPKMRAKMERVFRTFNPKGDPSKMTDAELFRAVNEHLRDTSSSGYTAKEDTPEEKAQRDQHQTKQTEDAELKAAFPWMKDSQINAMTPDMRQVWINRARGPKPGEKPAETASDQGENLKRQQGERAFADTTEQPGTATTSSPDKVVSDENPVNATPGTRKAPIAAKTADDVLAAQPREPKSAAQAEAENYKHAHMELEHLGLKGENSISIETGVGQTRKGPPGPDGKPAWEVKMEQGAYGRIKGTKGADGQPLDIMVGPHPASSHVFIINQHDPATGKFDELKIQAGYRTPLDAMHAYAVSFDDHARGRVGGMVAMTAEQFHKWLKTGDHTKAVQHASESGSVLARAFPDAGQSGKGSGNGSSVASESTIASSPGLHNAGEEARRPLTEAPAETSSPEVPKGTQGRDANEASPRPASITVHQGGRSKAGEKLSLLEFLADRGGIAHHPELEVLGLGPSHRVQIPGRKGFFGLIKEGGWDIDTAREAAEEEGYLQGENGNVTSTPKQFLDAVDAELRGTKLYPYQGEGQRTKVEDRLAAEREAYEKSRAQEIEDELDSAGYGEVAGELRQRALRHVAIGIDPETAIQTAMAEMDAELVVETPAEFDAIYGDGAYDEILAGIPYEGGPTSSGQSSEDHWSYEDALDRVGARAPDSVAAGDARRQEAADTEAAGGDESRAEGGPVRELPTAADDTAGRIEASGDEARDTARHEPAAEDADDTGAVAPRYDYDGASEVVQASDSDEAVTVTLSRSGPWDFSETFPAPDPAYLKGVDTEGRWPFDSLDASVEEIAGKVDAGVYDMMGEIGAMRAIDLQIEGIRSGKIKFKGKKNPEKEIAKLREERAQAAENTRELQGVFDEVFGTKAANAMVAEARRRLVDEERLAGKAKADEPRKVAEFIKHIEAEIGAGRMDAEISPTRSLDAFHKAAEARGWTYAAYGKGKALWSPDRQHVIFSSVSVEGNHVTAQWGTPSEGITPPGGTEPAPKKAKSVDDLTEAEKKAHRDAPTWAQVLSELPMHKDGKTREHEIAFDIIKEITGKKKAPKFDDLTPEQKGELYERVKARKPAELPLVYHGSTNKDFTEFGPAQVTKRGNGDHPGIYFTSDQRAAAGYARGGKIIAAHIDLKNPLNTTALIKKFQKQGMTFGDAKREALKSLTPEHDGIVFNGNSVNPPEYVAFKPEQVRVVKPATTETGADNKQQTVIPGAEKASDKTMAQRKAEAPLKPKANQKPADDGLFGDGHKQTDLLDMAKPSPKTNSDNFDAIFDEAINEQFAKPVSLDQATEGLKAIFAKKPAGLAESEAPFSDDTYAQALPYLKAGVASFANVGDLPAMVRALVSHLANAGMDADAIRAMKPYIRRFTDEVRSGKETINAPSRREVLERDRANATPENGVGAADVPAAAAGAGPRAGARGGEADAGEQRSAGSERLPEDYAPVVGERGHLEIPEREPVVDDSDAAAPESERSDPSGEEGFSFDQRSDAEAEGAAQRDADLNGRRKAQAEADAKRIPLKQGDLANIAATLPMLFPEQHDDVRAAEERFAKADGHGMLFTNGTGTGKTYSGLGIIKRFALAGKKQAIVIAPSQGILMDWQKSARDLGLDMHVLDSTVDKGRPGLNGTTYANFGDNAHLVDHEWDLIVPDEAHKLSSDQDGTTTQALRTLRALTYHPDGLPRRAEMMFRDLYDKIPKLPEKPTAEESARFTAALTAYNAKAGPAVKEWRARKRTNKAAFLSATPFAYHFSLDWAEGYLFDFPNDTNSGAYNAPTGRDSFYMQHLGYRKKTGKLTKPDAEVKQEVMERQLHEYLKKTGSLAGRMLTVDKDYDRKFILAHDAIGNQIDQALNFLQENEEFRPLHEYVSKKFDYLTRMRLLEAIKARSAIDYINQSLALGRKVVVFHDYNEGGGINPFDLSFSDDAKTTRYANGKHEDVELKPLYEDFLRQNPYVKELKFSDYPAPIATLTAAFPKALVYNGTVPKKKRNTNKALFNDDNSGHDLIIVQSAAGEAGISLHDTTGKHQRVTLNLGMPIRPVSSIQQEGRIYRVGQASDALFRYMNTGTDWERWTFAGKIADRAGTAENLALGNQARTIRQAFIDAFANADDNRPESGEGTGGKAADRAVTHSMSEFEKAKTHYFAQQKVKGRRDQREGTDYYATPEPLGLKMVEWANVKSGEKILEPSAGHGAIARYFPEDTHRTLVEPSSSLASRAALNSAGARVVNERFENLDTGANKFDAIVMNPPFGTAGATAIEHLAKAVKHLKNGGRIVALIPRGSTDGKYEKFIDSPAAKDIYLVGTINLPPVTFERAGTSISARVIVLEKQTDQEVRAKLQSKSRDFSGEKTIGELFDAIEHSTVPERLEPKTKDIDVPVNGGITINGIEFHLNGGSKGAVYADIKNKIGRELFAKTARMAEANGGRYIKTLKSFEFPSAAERQKFLDTVANPPKEAEPTAPAGVTFKSGETTHAKTGKLLYVASPDQRVARDVYDAMNAAAKAEGGYFSSYNSRGAIPGFQFPSKEARDKFLAKMGGKVAEAPPPFAGDKSADNFRAFATTGQPRGEAGQSYVLARGRATGNEQLIVFDKKGNAIGDEMGSAKGITFSRQLNTLVQTPGADLVLHHNHPSNRSFSPSDIALLGSPGVNTVWAHGHGGNVSRASLTDKAAQVLPENVETAKDVLRVAYARAENLLYNRMKNFVGSIDDDAKRHDAMDLLNESAGFITSTVLANAGIIEFESNFDIAPTLKLVPGILNTMKQAEASAGRAVFNGEFTATNGTDRRSRSVRHPGNMGVALDRAALATPVERSGRGNQADRGHDRGQESDTLPGLEDLDKTFNDLLGKRLLGRLGDLNATEMRVQLQDKFARVKNVEQDKGLTSTALSAYQAESLYYGRTGQRLESLKEHVVDPIIREMKGRDISLDMMDKFLYARHAPERNNAVGALYKNQPNHDFYRATIDPRVKGASGMSTGEANSFIGRLRTDGKLADYEAVGRMVDALNFRTRQTLLRGGLIDRTTFDALNSQYRHYVPLRGWQEGSNEDTLPHQSKGMDTRAKAFKQAFGRETIAASPLAYSIMQAEQAIVKAEKNKVGNTFLKFALANPDPDLWTINRPEPRKMVSKVTGMVHSSPMWDMNDPATFVTRVDGRANLIQFKGRDGENLARALKNMGSANVHTAVRMMGAVTHTMARLVTAWNPEFMIPNLIRDIGEAFINLGEQKQKAFVRKFAGHILPAMKGSWMAIAEKTSSGAGQAYIDAFNEFDREGGRVRFFGIDDPDAIEKNAEKRLKRLSGGAINSVKDLGDKAGKAMEIMGGGIENATRLAAYMAAKEVGMSAPDAAMLARNLTVNFNKKGELGTAIGSAYMFSNAAAQGQARMLRALHPKNRRVWASVGALAVAGVLSTSFNLGMGGSDSAGMANYMKIPSWERDKNIIIMGPGETYGKIPLPYGFAPFHVLGAHATTVLMGQEKPTAAAAAVFGSIASAFNPLGEEDSLIATLVPTALRPAVHIHYNENWTGKPLYPARDADKGRPESQQSFKTDTAASKAVAEGLNSLTGGDRYRPGAIDIHPGSLDHVMGAITGGVGKFVKNVVDTIVNGWNGQPWEASKTPILRRFVGKLDHAMADSSAYYDARKEATEEANRTRQAKRDLKTGADEQAARAFLDATPAGRQKLIFDRADQQMRRLRAEEERINNSPQPYEAKRAALDAVRLQMRDVQNRARAESARLKGQAK